MKMNIRGKLLLGFGSLLLVSIINTAVFYYLISEQNRSQSLIKNSEEINAHMLEARKHEKDFIMRNDQSYTEKHDHTVQELLEHISLLSSLEKDAVQQAALANLEAHVVLYKSEFDDVVSYTIQKGLDETSGLQGEFRSATHLIEEQIPEENKTLLAAMLMIRRREKDYLLRKTEEYVVKLDKEIETFSSLLKMEGLDSVLMMDLLNEYKSKFHALVDADRQIANSIAIFREEIHQISPIIESYITGMENQTEILSSRTTLIMILSISLSIVIALVIALYLSGTISRTIGKLTKGALEIAKGNLSSEKITVKSRDELGVLAKTFTDMQQSLKHKSVILNQIANGDLSVQISLASDIDELGQSLLAMKTSLNETLEMVNQSVVQVASGADQVSQSSQSLSQGAMEQASTLEQLTSSITEITNHTRQNSENAGAVNDLSKQSFENAEKGNLQMQELVEAMNRINASSDEIKHIVKTIDDIAFQINLLALNANVEAARAGKYGRGFAVVAEEVRNLAVRSAEAVKSTTTMVEDSIKNIETGNVLVSKTSDQLGEISLGVQKVADLVEEIAIASKEQTIGLEQISSGLSQIDDVTQSNTAGAEEGASASEELSSMAEQLKRMLLRFKLEFTDVRDLSAENSNGTEMDQHLLSEHEISIPNQDHMPVSTQMDHSENQYI